MFSRQIEVCQTQNNVNKIDNFFREIEVCQNNVNKSDNFSREIEVCKVFGLKFIIFLFRRWRIPFIWHLR